MRPLTHSDLLPLRLHNQRVGRAPLASPVDVVRWLGAAQAQEYISARWAVAMRTKKATEADLDAALASGDIVRTHVMRPTWHFVAREDVRWLLELTSPRVQGLCAGYYRTFGLDTRRLTRGAGVLARALEGGRQLTRAALRTSLERAKIVSAGDSPTAVAFVFMFAELERVICSGARAGKQFTYALFDERVPPAPFDRETALAALVRRFFVSHGPASTADFTWWSGLTAADARAGLASVGHELVSSDVDGRTYWMPRTRLAPPTGAALLAAYDEGLLAYRDNRTSLRSVPLRNGHAVVIDDAIVGTWTRTVRGRGLALTVIPFRALTRAERGLLDDVVERYGTFAGVPAALVLEPAS